jgi:hypothetical protein
MRYHNPKFRELLRDEKRIIHAMNRLVDGHFKQWVTTRPKSKSRSTRRAKPIEEEFSRALADARDALAGHDKEPLQLIVAHPFNMFSHDGKYTQLGDVVVMFLFSMHFGSTQSWAFTLYMESAYHDHITALVSRLGCNLKARYRYLGLFKDGSWVPPHDVNGDEVNSSMRGVPNGEFKQLQNTLRQRLGNDMQSSTRSFTSTSNSHAKPSSTMLGTYVLKNNNSNATGNATSNANASKNTMDFIDSFWHIDALDKVLDELQELESCYFPIKFLLGDNGHVNIVRIQRRDQKLRLFLFEPHGRTFERRYDEVPYDRVRVVLKLLVIKYNKSHLGHLPMEIEKGFCPKVQSYLPFCGMYSIYVGIVDDLMRRRFGFDGMTRAVVHEAVCKQERHFANVGRQISRKSMRSINNMQDSQVLQWINSSIESDTGVVDVASTCDLDITFIILWLCLVAPSVVGSGSV